MRGVRSLAACSMYMLGDSRGEGAAFEDGHSSVYPAWCWGSGVTRKESEETA